MRWPHKRWADGAIPDAHLSGFPFHLHISYIDRAANLEAFERAEDAGDASTPF